MMKLTGNLSPQFMHMRKRKQTAAPSRGTTPHLATPRNESPRARALRHMRQALIDDRWLPGERLPTEIQLARELDMSRRTIRAVYQQLEIDGQVVGMGRAGRFRMTARVAPSATLQAASIGLISCFLSRTVKLQPQHRQWESVTAGIMDASVHGGRPILMINSNGLTADRLKELLHASLLGLIVPEPWTLPEKLLLNGLRRFRRAGIPVVVGDPSDVYMKYDRVLIDHTAGTRLAVQALLARGCKKILRVWTVHNTSWIQQRDAGYEQAFAGTDVAPLAALHVPELHQRTLEPDADAFHIRSRQYAGFLIEHLRRGKVDALLLTSDSDIFPVSAACRLCGLRPGEDILLAGFDHYWSCCWERALEPVTPFLTVDKQNRDWGEAMVQLLFDRLAKRLPQQPKIRWIEPQIVFA